MVASHDAAALRPDGGLGAHCRSISKASAARFDLREAFRRDAGPLRSVQPGGAPCFRRPVQEPDRHAGPGAAARAGARVRARAPPRRHVRRRAHQQHRTASRQALAAARARRARAATPMRREVHATLDAMLAYARAGARRRCDHRRREHRHRRLGPRAADGRGGAGRVRAAGQALPFRLQRRRPRTRRRAAPAAAAKHAVPGRIQDLHHHRDHDQRAFGACLVRGPGRDATSRGTSRRSPPTWRPRASSASPPPSASGTGWAGAIRCGRRSACPLRSPSARRAFASCWRARTRWTGTSPPRRCERNLPVRLGLLDVWNRNFHGFTSRSIAPYHSALRRLPAYLQQLEMESNGKRVDAQGRPLVASRPRRCCGASPAPTASMRISRCCTRARMWCRWSSSP